MKAENSNQPSWFWTESWHYKQSSCTEEVCGWLKTRCVGKRILDVGVGSCAVFKQCKGAEVLGITVVRVERNLANLIGCRSFLADKYHELDLVPGTFDYIVDYNPFSYTPYKEDGERLMDNYYAMLNDGGALVSHKKGVVWRHAPVPPWPGGGQHWEWDLWETFLELLSRRFIVNEHGSVLECLKR